MILIFVKNWVERLSEIVDVKVKFKWFDNAQINYVDQ